MFFLVWLFYRVLVFSQFFTGWKLSSKSNWGRLVYCCSCYIQLVVVNRLSLSLGIICCVIIGFWSFSRLLLQTLCARMLITACSMLLAHVTALLSSGWVQSVNYTGAHFIDSALTTSCISYYCDLPVVILTHHTMLHRIIGLLCQTLVARPINTTSFQRYLQSGQSL